ncbi:hypothetical protein ACVWWJ_004164 [Luteibacter sp. HA06]
MRPFAWLVVLLLTPTDVGARAADVPPIQVTPCQLLSDPGRYNHELVQVYGLISHGFEQFDMSSGKCPIHDGMSTGLWLEYGGKRQSQTAYCCSNATGPDRAEVLVVESLKCDLVDDARFKQFDHLLHRRHESSVTATIVARFFAGEESKINGKKFWGGYGHMGFGSLLVVEQVLSVSPAAYAPYSNDPLPVLTGKLPNIDARLLAPAK